VSALSKGFQIVEAVAGAGGTGLTFARVVERTGIPKASAHRLLRELVELSALTFDSDTRKYRGGLLLARIGADVTGQYDLRTIARPFLQALHDEFGHVATLGIRNDDVGIYIDKIEAADFGLRLHSEIGKSFPLHCTAMGKVLLSHADSTVIRRVLNRKLEAYTENTITSATQLREELQQTKARGFAVDNEEITRGLVCVAAPIFGVDGEVAGAMSCTVPSHVNDDQSQAARIESVCRLANAATTGR
jgi:DNA-binding IclR family transcriptional regulator